MKRSQNLRLVLMAAAAPALTACESEPTGQVLASVEQCAGQAEISLDECQAAYRTALAEHEKLAPRFSSQAECNEQFGGCTPLSEPTGQVSYIPPMAGFLIGYALGDLDFDRRKRRHYGIGGVSPLYRDYRSRDFLKPGGEYVGDRYGTVRGKYGNTALPTRAVTVSRSGFGSSASARGGFGSSRGFGG